MGSQDQFWQELIPMNEYPSSFLEYTPFQRGGKTFLQGNLPWSVSILLTVSESLGLMSEYTDSLEDRD